MKTLTKSLLIAAGAISFSAIADENNSIPEAIYVPDNAEMTDADKAWVGEGFDYEADVTGTTVAALSEEIVDFYAEQGFETEENDIEDDEAEFVFTRGEERVEIDVELEDENLIEYEVDYDK